MKVLLVNKFAHSQGKSGGVGTYLAQVESVLKSAGHEVEYFGMQDKYSKERTYYKYFVPDLDLSSVSWQSIKAIFMFIYSPEARRRFGRVLDDFKPDIVHINNIYHHMSASILLATRERGIPVVQTVHDFHHISGNYNLFNSRTSALDLNCCGSRALAAVYHRCINSSALYGLAAALRYYFDFWSKIYIRNVKIFMMPSRFMIQRHLLHGFDKKSVEHVPHSVVCSGKKPKESTKKDRYILAWGRLSPEKGYEVLVRALQELPDITLKIAGDGPDRERLGELIRDNNITNVELLGFIAPKKLNSIVNQCEFAVLPSIGYENFPYAVLESMCHGKPVVAPDTGGISEMISHRKTGLLYPDPTDHKQLAKRIDELWGDSKLAKSYGKSAKVTVRDKYSFEQFSQKLLGVYSSVLKDEF